MGEASLTSESSTKSAPGFTQRLRDCVHPGSRLKEHLVAGEGDKADGDKASGSKDISENLLDCKESDPLLSVVLADG